MVMSFSLIHIGSKLTAYRNTRTYCGMYDQPLRLEIEVGFKLSVSS